ncbi:MAG: phosphopantothenoylcysteine decarboxylase domain-containing protein [Planctomycetaceae bacterium]
MRLLLTAGPTREYLDDVRFLSNASSGRMGYALALAARRRGHEVVLVSGPVALPAPAGCEFHQIETSAEMLAACLRVFPACDGVIGAAAVCDYRPRERAAGKLKKTGGPRMLELVETTDILAELGRNKEKRFVVGFALESHNARANALRKLKAKHCDAIVLNAPAAIGAESSSAELIDRNGQTVATWSAGKAAIADALIAWVELHLARQSGGSG